MRGLFRFATAPILGIARRVRRHLPTDLVVVWGFVLLATWVLITWNPTSPFVRAVVGVPLLFFLPGYALVSLLYPRSVPADVTTETNDSAERVQGVTDLERAALSVGTSFAVLPLLGLAVATIAALTTTAVVSAVSGFVLVVSVLAAVRRLRVPHHERYRVDIAERVATVRGALDRESSDHFAVNVVLVVSVLLALTTGGYALLAPQDGEQYTGMQLLTEDDGDLVAADYTEEIEPGEVVPLVVAVENQEGETTEYTVVAQQQRLEDGEVTDREEIDRFDYRLADDTTGYADRTLEPTAEEGEVRLAFLLYEDGDVPETPTTENAYRYIHVWVEIQSDAE